MMLAATWFSAEARSVALANFYTGLLGVPDHQILNFWSFTV
jgi:hypothetical protein